jgi:hypothetical protein
MLLWKVDSENKHCCPIYLDSSIIYRFLLVVSLEQVLPHLRIVAVPTYYPLRLPRVRSLYPSGGGRQVPLNANRFARLVSTVADVLVESNPDLAGQTLPDSSTECLVLARQRFKEGQAVDKQVSVGLGETLGGTSLAQMSVDLALKPYLEWAAEQVLSHVEEGHWKHNSCPACGGAPDFAFLGAESGTRHLLCSRCSSQWPFRRIGCPFCGTRDHTKLSYYLSEDEAYRLYVCQACRRYLKVLDLRKVGRQALFPVERITTMHMDVAAQQAGYR